jgi:hypothetical protein
LTTLESSGLIEDRSDGGSWIGPSGNLSVPIGHHHGVRYSAGRNYGRYMKAPPAPTIVDVGRTTLTNKRLVFRGQGQVRECPFDQMIGFDFTENGGCISIGTSKRQQTTRIRYGTDLDSWFSIRFKFALAMSAGDAERYLRTLKEPIQL